MKQLQDYGTLVLSNKAYKILKGKELGMKLRKARTTAKLEVKELAKMMDVSEPTIYAYENGIRYPSIEIIGKYCQALNREYFDLFFERQ